MFNDHPVVAFSLASFAVAISPGPSWFYVISTTAEYGRTSGFVAVLGNGAGIFCHVMAAAMGVSAILTWSLTAYAALKWLGACYLVFLGIRVLLEQDKPRTALARSRSSKSNYSILLNGLLVNILNPKVALLMIALLPQFVNPAPGHTVSSTMGIGAMHVLIASFVLTCIVFATARGVSMFADSKTPGGLVRYVSGSVLIGFGVRLAIEGGR